MKEVIRRGLVAPGVVAGLAVIAWLVAGSGGALAVVALGAAAITGRHLHQAQRLHDWSAGRLQVPVPEAHGDWGEVFAAVHRRVRLREAHQRDLAQTIARFREAAAAIPDGILVLDHEQRIEWANPQAIAQHGLDLRHDVGQPIVNLVRQPEFLRYVEAGDFGTSAMVPSARHPGRMLALQLVPFGLHESLLLSRDVTEMEAVARMRRDFIANVSHELKTPLTVISGFIETLQDVDIDEDQRARFLGLMQEQSHNMQRLVSDLLTLSALESEHNPLVEDRFAVGPMLEALANDAAALADGGHEIRVDAGPAATIAGNRDELMSAFGNLVTNAVRYTPGGGTITIGWRVDADGSGLFCVTDTGIGIAPMHLPRLTERFYRVDRSRSRATGGTGLGLAIVKHVAQRHQAELTVESELGQGSRFSVRLPARRVRLAAMEQTTGDGPPG